jgi:hypothetical protein
VRVWGMIMSSPRAVDLLGTHAPREELDALGGVCPRTISAVLRASWTHLSVMALVHLAKRNEHEVPQQPLIHPNPEFCLLTDAVEDE